MFENTPDPGLAEQVLLGGLLGDGYLYQRKIYSKNPRTTIYPFYRAHHGLAQRDYCKWKADAMGFHFYECRTGCYLTSPQTDEMMDLWSRWYPEGEKVLCVEDLKKLDVRALLIWFLDDAHCAIRSIHSSYVEIYTGSFNEEENDALIHWLGELDILGEPRYREKRSHQTKGQWSIKVRTEHTDKLLKLLMPVYQDVKIPSCTDYKLCHVHPANRERIGEKVRLKIARRKELRPAGDPLQQAIWREEYRRKKNNKLLTLPVTS